MFVHTKLCSKFARSNAILAYGVIGNTAGFGPVVQGSSPCRPTLWIINPDAERYRDFCFYAKSSVVGSLFVLWT